MGPSSTRTSDDFPSNLFGVQVGKTYRVSTCSRNICNASACTHDAAADKMSEIDLHIILNTIIGIGFTEAILKPIVVRMTRSILRHVDRYVKLIPDWLYNRGVQD